MKLNGDKCKEIISFFREEMDIPHLCLKNIPLEFATSFKVPLQRKNI